MYNCRYAPWDHYPKFLSFNEVQNPLIPLYDFFTADSIKGHKQHLKTWRYYVINKACYKGSKYGPGELLYEYELNVKLLEGAYLLLLSYEDIRSDKAVADDEQIKAEKDSWTYFPNVLTKKYLTDPYLALKKIFKNIKPQDFRDCLNMWLSDALHNRATDDVTEPAEIINVYDKLKLLYDVAWVIYQRESDDPYLKDHYGTAAKMEKIAKRLIIKELFPSVPAGDKMLVEQLAEFISERFPMINMICYLGKSDTPQIYYLVLIRNEDKAIDDGELGNKIEDHSKHIANVFLIVHRFPTVVSGLENGARFWTNLINKASVLYQREKNILLPAPQQISFATLTDRAKDQWKRWGKQGSQFTKSAEYFLKKADYIQASFMLNQAARHFLKAAIQSVLGYRVQAHNLSRLINLTLLFTSEIMAVFKLEKEDNAEVLNFIKQAGQLAQYQDDFVPDEKMILRSLKLIRKLALTSEAVQHRFVKDLTKLEDSPIKLELHYK